MPRDIATAAERQQCTAAGVARVDIHFKYIVEVNTTYALSVRRTTPFLLAIQMTNYGLQCGPRSNWKRNVTTILALLGSAIIGLAIGLFFRVWAIVLVSPVIAILAAIVLQASGFGFLAGVSVVTGCLVVSQIAYLLAAAFHLHKGDISVQDEADADPGEHRYQDVRDKHQ